MTQECLQLENQLDELNVLSNWVAEIADRLGLASKVTFRLDLVLTEAITNIIENAYVDQADHIITLHLDSDAQTVRVKIVDDGIPFNPLEHPETVLPTQLDGADMGGLGIHLIRSYTKTCDYQRLGQENHFTVVLSTEA